MADAWNHFVAQSKNGTFLLDRRYMDYHADRFEDHSLMVYRQGKLCLAARQCEERHILFSSRSYLWRVDDE